MERIDKWNHRYQSVSALPPPCQVLANYTYLLPVTGKAVDLACGLGANALLLAQHGLETYAWDYAPAAITRLQSEAQNQQLHLHTEIRDIITSPPPPTSFDVIVICHFLARKLVPTLVAALKPQGLLFYQTFTRTTVTDCGPHNAEFRLADGELLQLFQALRPVIYHEERDIGDTTQGLRNEAMLIAQKA
jgi:tellurite methyltransferase